MRVILLSQLKVGQYFKLENGMIFRVECNDWWQNGRLRDFICVDATGHKKHFSFFDSTTEITATIVDDFDQVNVCKNCGHAL